MSLPSSIIAVLQYFDLLFMAAESGYFVMELLSLLGCDKTILQAVAKMLTLSFYACSLQAMVL